jgi:hypothetical protein
MKYKRNVSEKLALSKRFQLKKNVWKMKNIILEKSYFIMNKTQ